MTRWEYMAIEMNREKSSLLQRSKIDAPSPTTFKRLGEDGWELVTCWTSRLLVTFHFKRPMKEE